MAETVQGARRSSRLQLWAWPAGAAALSLLLSLWRLEYKSLSADEGVSAAVIQMKAGALWDHFTQVEPNFALYYALLKIWTRGSYSEFSLRSLSVLLVASAVPLLFLLATRLGGRRAGIIAALLLSANTLVISTAQSARPYALVLLLVIASTYTFMVGVEQRSRLVLLLWALISVLAVHAHPLAALVVGAQLVSLLFLPRKDVPWGMIVANGALMLIALTPLLALLIQSGGERIEWISRPTLRDVAYVVERMAGGTTPLLAFYLAAAAAATFGAASAWRRSGRGRHIWGLALAISWLAIPSAAIVAASFVKPLVVPRYMIVALPGLILLAGAALAAIRPTGVRWAALVLVSVLLAHSLIDRVDHRGFDDWRGASLYVARWAQATDAIVLLPWHMSVFEYYYERSGVARNDRARLVPHDPGQPDASLGSARIWVLDNAPNPRQVSSKLSGAVGSQYVFQRHRVLRGVTVRLYERTAMRAVSGG